MTCSIKTSYFRKLGSSQSSREIKYKYQKFGWATISPFLWVVVVPHSPELWRHTVSPMVNFFSSKIDFFILLPACLLVCFSYSLQIPRFWEIEFGSLDHDSKGKVEERGLSLQEPSPPEERERHYEEEQTFSSVSS